MSQQKTIKKKLVGAGTFESLTPFQKKVLEATREIPVGKVTTYKLLGEHIHCNSPRAVGSALKKNPCVKTYFCHRVIPTSMKIGGYFGKTEGSNIDVKLGRLKSEGVEFNEKGVLMDKTKVHVFGGTEFHRTSFDAGL